MLDDAPVTVPLPTAGVLGVTGPDAVRRALLRWLVAQVAVLHSPVDVRLHVVAPGGDGWAWTGWLPHTAAAAGSRCTATVAADRDQAVRRVDELARLVRGRSQRGVDADGRGSCCSWTEPGGWPTCPGWPPCWARVPGSVS